MVMHFEHLGFFFVIPGLVSWEKWWGVLGLECGKECFSFADMFAFCLNLHLISTEFLCWRDVYTREIDSYSIYDFDFVNLYTVRDLLVLLGSLSKLKPKCMSIFQGSHLISTAHDPVMSQHLVGKVDFRSCTKIQSLSSWPWSVSLSCLTGQCSLSPQPLLHHHPSP